MPFRVVLHLQEVTIVKRRRRNLCILDGDRCRHHAPSDFDTVLIVILLAKTALDGLLKNRFYSVEFASACLWPRLGLVVLFAAIILALVVRQRCTEMAAVSLPTLPPIHSTFSTKVTDFSYEKNACLGYSYEYIVRVNGENRFR